MQHFKNTILLSNYLTLQTFSILKKPFCLCANSSNFTSDERVKMTESRPNSWTVSLCGIKTLFNERRVRIVSRDRNRFDRHQHSRPLVHIPKTKENKAQKIGSGPEVAILGPEQKHHGLRTRMWTCFMQNLQNIKFCLLVAPQLHWILVVYFYVRWELNQIEAKKPLN